MLFPPVFTKGINAKLNELESESDIFPQNEGKVGKSELTPVVKALTNCAVLVHFSSSPVLLSYMEWCCMAISAHMYGWLGGLRVH